MIRFKHTLAAIGLALGIAAAPALHAQTIEADDGGYAGAQQQGDSYLAKQQEWTNFMLGSWVFEEVIQLPVQGERVVETIITFTQDYHFERRMTDMETGKNISNQGRFEVRPTASDSRFVIIMMMPGKPARPTVINKLDDNRIKIRANEAIATRL